jgi:hypothetical protein
MIANLYICNRSFNWNGTDSLKELKAKMANFQEMLEIVSDHKEDNVIFVFKEGLLSTTLLPGADFVKLLSDREFAINNIGHECYVILMGMLKHCKETKATLHDIKEYMTYEDKDNCHGVIVFSPIKNLDEKFQVISTVDGWFRFRRYYLGKYPNNPKFFLTESEKYFPSIKIHPSNNSAIKDYLDSHPKLIVKYLSLLNDRFAKEFLESEKDLKMFLPAFAITYGIEDASLEGSKEAKFFFQFDDEIKKLAYCEAHLKMYHDDDGNDNQHCRIYFSKPLPEEKFLYVGHIGDHL